MGRSPSSWSVTGMDKSIQLRRECAKKHRTYFSREHPSCGLSRYIMCVAMRTKCNDKTFYSRYTFDSFSLSKVKRDFSPFFENRLHFTQDRLEHFDAVIATGSNNAARYFEHYFAKVPHIIRKNRNGIAVLSGEESKEELAGLAQDIVQYFGLGCRSISKVYLPEGYDLNNIFGALYPHADLMDSAKYANNYDYNKAVYLMSEFDLLDNGFMLLREHDSFGSPVACLHYSYYRDLASLEKELLEKSEKIQCISTHLGLSQSCSARENPTTLAMGICRRSRSYLLFC